MNNNATSVKMNDFSLQHQLQPQKQYQQPGTGFGVGDSPSTGSLGSSRPPPGFGTSPLVRGSTGFGTSPMTAGFGTSPMTAGFGTSPMITDRSDRAERPPMGFGTSPADRPGRDRPGAEFGSSPMAIFGTPPTDQRQLSGVFGTPQNEQLEFGTPPEYRGPAFGGSSSMLPPPPLPPNIDLSKPPPGFSS